MLPQKGSIDHKYHYGYGYFMIDHIDLNEEKRKQVQGTYRLMKRLNEINIDILESLVIFAPKHFICNHAITLTLNNFKLQSLTESC